MHSGQWVAFSWNRIRIPPLWDKELGSSCIVGSELLLEQEQHSTCKVDADLPFARIDPPIWVECWSQPTMHTKRSLEGTLWPCGHDGGLAVVRSPVLTLPPREYGGSLVVWPGMPFPNLDGRIHQSPVLESSLNGGACFCLAQAGEHLSWQLSAHQV